jgi:Flp pilus assembly protein TadD
MRYSGTACLLIVAATLFVYWQAGSHDFIVYDDPLYVTGNVKVKSGLNPDSVYWAFTTDHASNWHPLTWLSHMLDVRIFGPDPMWHHRMNVFFHLANTCLLYLLLSRMTASRWQSLFVAGLFALHPLHIESVAWVSERKDLLSTFFLFLTLLSYHGYVKRRTASRYILTLCAFAFGLLSKPMLVTLPFVLLLLDFWPLGRLDFRRTGLQAESNDVAGNRKAVFIRLILEKVPFFILSFASSLITVHAQRQAIAHSKAVPLVFRCVNALLAYVYYLGKMFWPINLAVIYPLPSTWTILQGAEAFLLLTAITALCIGMAYRHPPLLVGWLWYLGTLVPVIGLVQVGRQFIADRYTYIPLIGIFMMFAWGVPGLVRDLVRDKRAERIVLSSLGGFILLACSVVTWHQLGYWKDSVTLFQRATDVFPDNYIARNILGNALSDKDRIDEAIFHFSQVLKVWPDDEEALTGVGTVLAKQGKGEEALRYFNEVLRLNPKSPGVHFQVGLLLAERGKIDECIYHFNNVLQIVPEDVEAHHNLGVALVKKGKLEEAISHFTEALRLQPDLAQAAISLKAAYKLKYGSDGR